MQTPKSVNRFMFFVLLYTVLSSFLLSFVIDNFLPNISVSVYMLISGICSPVLPVLFYFFLMKGGGNLKIPVNNLGFINAVLLTCLAFCVQPVLMLISGAGSLIFPNPVSAVVDAVYTKELPGVIMASVSIMAIPAVFEELLLRGIIFSGYKNVPFAAAATVNALLFGMWHLNFQQFFYAFIMGYLLCYIVRLTKSIYASIYVHLLVNGLQFVLSYYSLSLLESGDVQQLAGQGSEYDILVTAVLGLLPLAIMSLFTVLSLLYVFAKHNKKRNENSPVAEPDILRSNVFTDGFWGTAAVFFAFSLLHILVSFGII